MDDVIDKARGRRSLVTEIASRSTDPHFYAALTVLPNPDTVLRKLGRAHDVFDAMFGDAHILGELRAIRAGLLRYPGQVQPGGEDAADTRAYELCTQWLDESGIVSDDLRWSIYMAVLLGYRCHEVVWGPRRAGIQLPVRVVDRPNRRFVFDTDNNLRLLTRQAPTDGVEIPPRRILLTRHMASNENPYGVAVLSSCFWPYTFKHNGFRYFVRFCERFGIPWAVGKHPRGTPDEEIEAIVDSLAQMIEDGVGSIPDDGSVELIQTSTTGSKLAQERLIAVCNREISKALTSQTLSTEIDGEASRAAAETHAEKGEGVNGAERKMVADTISEIFAWITYLNVPDATPPTYSIEDEEEKTAAAADFIVRASEVVEIPTWWAYERLGIPQPQEGDQIIERRRRQPVPGVDFAAPEQIETPSEQAARAASGAIADMAAPVLALFDEVDSLEEFRDGLTRIYPAISEERLAEITRQALEFAALKGAETELQNGGGRRFDEE